MTDDLPKYLKGATRYFDAKAWAALAKRAERRTSGGPANTRKGWKTRRRNVAARQEAERGRRGFEKAAVWKETIETRGLARWHILAALEPGAWYALADVAALSGMPSNTVKAKVNTLLIAEGLIAKVENPQWYDRRDEKGFKVWLEPRYLYGLTESGIAARAVARGELEARGWPDYATGQKRTP